MKKSCINFECCISKHAYEFITIYLFFNEFQGMRTLKKKLWTLDWERKGLYWENINEFYIGTTTGSVQ